MIWLWIALGVLVTAAIVLIIVSDVLFRGSFVRVRDYPEFERKSYEFMRQNGQSELVDRIMEGRSYIETLQHEDLYLTSYDGLKLHACFFPNGDSHRTIVLVHGYKSYGYHDFACAFEFYRSLGLNFLIVDQRSHGKSEGKYITFGVRERYDIRDWVKLLAEQRPDDEVILGGISMGCATVLLAAGLDDMPKNVVGVIADCGYTCPRDEIAYVMKHSMNIPLFPFLGLAHSMARHRAKFGFSEATTLDAVKNIDLPVLFIHGDADTFVLPEHSKQNYAACKSERKKLVIVPGAGHGLSYVTDEAGCRRELKEFVESL